MRAHLDKRPIALIQQRPRSTLELDALTKIAIPILRVQLLGIDRPTTHRRVQRHSVATRHDPGTAREQLVADLLDLSGVCRVVDRDPARFDSVGLTLREQSLERAHPT
jgi:hypothetical protein